MVLNSHLVSSVILFNFVFIIWYAINDGIAETKPIIVVNRAEDTPGAIVTSDASFIIATALKLEEIPTTVPKSPKKVDVVAEIKRNVIPFFNLFKDLLPATIITSYNLSLKDSFLLSPFFITSWIFVFVHSCIAAINTIIVGVLAEFLTFW